MSMFGSILSKVFGGGSAQAAAIQSGTMDTTPRDTTPGATPPVSGVAQAPSVTQAANGPPVDVAALLSDLAAKSGGPSNWQSSIVDMLKLLGLDSSLDSRKELARELHYSGDTNDSARMNVWLHGQVMQKLAENGGKVPESLRG
jgi:hypothetical protein